MAFTPQQLAQISALIAASMRAPSPPAQEQAPAPSTHQLPFQAQMQGRESLLGSRPPSTHQVGSASLALSQAPMLGVGLIGRINDAALRAKDERELVKRLCTLLRPTHENVWPPLLRVALLSPAELTSSPNLRARLMAVARRLEQEYPALITLLKEAGDRPLNTTDLGATTMASVDCFLLAATELAKEVGPWTIMARVDLLRTQRHIPERYERAELTTVLENLCEEWLLGEQSMKRPREEEKKTLLPMLRK